MLKEHLSQAHDAASRRFKIIDKQVDWIHISLLSSQVFQHSRLGLRSRFLLRSTGVTWVIPAMASIIHRLQSSMLLPPLNVSNWIATTFARISVRQNTQRNIDLVMLIYGEFNVFRPVDTGKSWINPGRH